MCIVILDMAVVIIIDCESIYCFGLVLPAVFAVWGMLVILKNSISVSAYANRLAAVFRLKDCFLLYVDLKSLSGHPDHFRTSPFLKLDLR